jgi:CBS-domain-containing membrane protein
MATQSSEDLEKILKTKADLLRLTNEDTKDIIAEAKTRELERQRKTLDSKLQEVHDLKLRIQEKKLEEGIKPEDVRTWTGNIKKNDIAPI